MILLTIFVFIAIFSLLILIHELGHFTAAKRAGVKVEEFGFGLPPRITGIRRGETLYSINWIPFGGFVRMLGEDSSNKKAKTSKRSFNNQPLSVQAWIVSAGVVMNLLLAFVLLTIGFWIGMEPLIVNQDDFVDAIVEGTVVVEPGIVVVESDEPWHSVVNDGEDLEIRSFSPGDRLSDFETLEEFYAYVEALKGGAESEIIAVDYADGGDGGEYLTAELLDLLTFTPLYLERMLVQSSTGDKSEMFEAGDVILTVNGVEAFSYSDLEGSDLDIEVYRFGSGVLMFKDVDFSLKDTVYQEFTPVVVTFVQEGEPAEEAGVKPGDLILSIGGEAVEGIDGVVDANNSRAVNGVVDYEVQRGDDVLNFSIAVNEEGLVGIGIDDIDVTYGGINLYKAYVAHSLMKIKTVQHGVEAPLIAAKEILRLGKITAVMFVGVFKDFLTASEVPAGVAGPVGIAQMTYTTLQNGFAAMLRFVALLSLSLGVINILPFPALDGGRLVFIIYYGVTGHKPNAKLENLIHTMGFFLLIFFILYITFNDVVNLF